MCARLFHSPGCNGISPYVRLRLRHSSRYRQTERQTETHGGGTIAGSFGNVIEREIQNRYFGAVVVAPPANLYFALFTALSADGATVTEVTGNGYSRVAVVNSLTNFPEVTTDDQVKTNAIALEWPVPTPAGWGTVVGAGVYSALTGGTLILWSDLPVSQVVNAGQPPRIGVGEFTHTMN